MEQKIFRIGHALGDYGAVAKHGILEGGPLGDGPPTLSGCIPFAAMTLPTGRLCVSGDLMESIRGEWPNLAKFTRCQFGKLVKYEWNGEPPSSGEPIDYLSKFPECKSNSPMFVVECSHTTQRLISPTLKELLEDPSKALESPIRFETPIVDSFPPLFAGVYMGRPNKFFLTSEFLSKVSREALGDAIDLYEYSSVTGLPASVDEAC